MILTDNVILWGTGIIGKRYYELLRLIGVTPIAFIDNNINNQGSFINNIPIYAPEQLKMFGDYSLIIACRSSDEVFEQALRIGVNSKHICKVEEAWRILIKCCIDKNVWKLESNGDIYNKDKVNFDFQNGAALGGVETWSLEQGKTLYNAGKKVTYMLGNNNAQLDIPDCFNKVIINQYCEIYETIINIVRYLNNNCYGTVISNFVGTNMYANCYFKRLNNNIMHIMIIHSDDPIYYETAILLQKYIDYCLVISQKIKSQLILRGMDSDKIVTLNWNIKVDDEFRKLQLDRPIRIGYAGRITTLAKRVDYIPIIIEKLNDIGVNYIFEIAGIGDYYDELSKFVDNNKLKGKVCLLGQIDKSYIKGFWRRQDIYISCSDWEGHSISQCEAIATGAVPVVTDVSGACDDIDDGVTGYIVPIGDLNMIVEKISYLDSNRYILNNMSKAGMNKMLERNKLYNDNILEELCR
mgnify:FL=1